MFETKSIDQIGLMIEYLVPGFIIIYVRAQFLTGRIDLHKDAILRYFALTVVYLAIVNAATSVITGNNSSTYWQTRYWLPILLAGSVIFGALVGLNASLGLTRRFLWHLGIHLPHAMDTAWDWRFSRLSPCLLMVTLKDGSQVAGWCGDGSFIGSGPVGDLYIEQVYAVDDSGNWHINTQGKGIYIAGSEIRTVEVVPANAGEWK